MAEEQNKTEDDYSPNVPPKDMMSYASMGLASNKWARTERSWVNLLVIFLLVVMCLGSNMLCAAWYYGWDNLLTLLGWK